MQGWEIVKAVSTACGSIGTAMIFLIRHITRARVREDRVHNSVESLQETVADLKTTKIDRQTYDLTLEFIKKELTEIRSDTRAIDAKMEKMSIHLGKLEGSVKTAMELRTKTHL